MMAQIRDTVILLAEILRGNGTSKVKAETFRIAKFDKNDAVEPLWKLLFELLYYCNYGKVDDVCLKAFREMNMEERVVYVKTELQERGFHSRDFGKLPLNMSIGSRELLLAFGWFMCKESIVDRFMTNCTSPLDDDTVSLHQQDVDELWKQKDNNLHGNFATNPELRVNQLLLLNNKLQLSLRGLLALQLEKNRLAHKIHMATKSNSLAGERDHLSVLEVYMLKHPEILKKNLELLEKDNERLKNLLSWREHEDTFWRWMETVLDAKLEDLNQEDISNNQESVSCLPADSVAKLQDSHNRLQDAILKYENIVDRLETLWKIKSSEVSEAELDNVLAAIDLEISIQRANIALNNTDVYLQRAGYPKLCHVSKPVKLVHGACRTSDTEDTSQDMEEEIGMMEELMDRLQNGIIEQQNTYKEEMNELCDKFSDAICIPPMARKSF